jgi:hypothetical protein
MVGAGVEGEISGEVTDVAATHLASQWPRAPCNLVSALDRMVNHSVQKFDALRPWSWRSPNGERCPDGSLGGTEDRLVTAIGNSACSQQLTLSSLQ